MGWTARHDDEWELRLREHTVRAGVLLTWAVCAAVAVYVLLTRGEPHRVAIGVLIALGVVSGVVIELLPVARIVRSAWREVFFVAWSLVEVGLLLVLLTLDGGPASPTAALLVVPVVFAGVSYPPRFVVAVGVATIAGTAAVAPLAPDLDLARLLLLVVGIALTAAMSAWHARNHARQHRRLALLSRTDALTGALNRRGFEERLDAALALTAARERPLGLLLIDLDRFKHVNDTLGHAAGDRLLRAVTAALSDAVRTGDLVARLGGDELAVVLADARPGALAEVEARLRAAVARQTPASFGLALAPEDGVDREQLLRTADERLYAEKTGRRAEREAAPVLP